MERLNKGDLTTTEHFTERLTHSVSASVSKRRKVFAIVLAD